MLFCRPRKILSVLCSRDLRNLGMRQMLGKRQPEISELGSWRNLNPQSRDIKPYLLSDVFAWQVESCEAVCPFSKRFTKFAMLKFATCVPGLQFSMPCSKIAQQCVWGKHSSSLLKSHEIKEPRPWDGTQTLNLFWSKVRRLMHSVTCSTLTLEVAFRNSLSEIDF